MSLLLEKLLIRKLCARRLCFVAVVCAPRQEAYEGSVVQEEVSYCFHFIAILFNSFKNISSKRESSLFLVFSFTVWIHSHVRVSPST